VREHERRHLQRLLGAAGVESERQLSGAARLALHKLVTDRRAAELVEGIAQYAQVARDVGLFEGQALAEADRQSDRRGRP